MSDKTNTFPCPLCGADVLFSNFLKVYNCSKCSFSSKNKLTSFEYINIKNGFKNEN